MWWFWSACVATSEPEVCEEELATYCAAADCPAAPDAIACTTELTEVTCGGYTTWLCPADNSTAALYWYDEAGALVAVATQACPLPLDTGPRPCADRGGWFLHGPLDAEIVECASGTSMGECYE